jgi:DNA-binding GntR family transcriptional regulator
MRAQQSKTRRGRALRSRPPKGRGAAEVHLALRSQILHLELKPGAKLDEMGLVRQFGISRTPVREALIRLASEGLVFLLPNRGAQVAPLDLVDIAQYFEALELVQRAVNRCAALRRSDGDLVEIRRERDAFREATRRDDRAAIIQSNRDLHAAIATAAHNSHLEMAMIGLLNHGMRLNWICHERFNAGDLGRHNKRGHLEHERIVRAIEKRDAEAADRLGRIHTESFRQRVKDFLSDSFTGAIAIGGVLR